MVSVRDSGSSGPGSRLALLFYFLFFFIRFIRNANKYLQLKFAIFTLSGFSLLLLLLLLLLLTFYCNIVNCNIANLGLVIVLCSWARHFTVIVPLSIQVYKWVPANLLLGGGGGGVTLRWTSIPSRANRNTPRRFMLLKPG